jgi:hypothetical protein
MHHSSLLRMPHGHPNHTWWVKMSTTNTQTTSIFTNDRPAFITDWQQQKLYHGHGTVWNWRQAMTQDEYYKDKVAPVHVMKTHRRRGTASLTLNSELYAVQRSSGRERNPVRIRQEAWWTWTIQRREISLVPVGIRTPDRSAPSCRKWA